MSKHGAFVLVVILLGFSNVALGGTILVWDCIDANGEPITDFLCDVPQGNDYVAITVYWAHALAIKNDGSLVAWGSNHDGQCDVPDGNDFVKVGAGALHSVALKSNGTLVAWGNNGHGQCDVPDGNDFVDVAAGSATNVALTSEGSLVEWGYHYTESPHPNDPNAYDPNCCDVPSGNDFAAAALGQGFCVALKSDGSLVAWGQNIFGERDVPEGNDFTKVAADTKHGLAVRKDGTVVGWGRNNDGQCDVPAGSYIDIAAGGYHSVAIKSDGSLIAWGRNIDGQWNVPDGNDFVAIAAGDEHSLALTSGELVTLTVQTEPNDMSSVLPAIGEHTYYIGQRVLINARRCPKCPDVYQFDHWTGDVPNPDSASQYLIMTADKSIMAHYVARERVCGDECHPILQGDLNEDCYINFDDFAIYAEKWLWCTHPDCD